MKGEDDQSKETVSPDRPTVPLEAGATPLPFRVVRAEAASGRVATAAPRASALSVFVIATYLNVGAAPREEGKGTTRLRSISLIMQGADLSTVFPSFHVRVAKNHCCGCELRRLCGGCRRILAGLCRTPLISAGFRPLSGHNAPTPPPSGPGRFGHPGCCAAARRRQKPMKAASALSGAARLPSRALSCTQARHSCSSA